MHSIESFLIICPSTRVLEYQVTPLVDETLEVDDKEYQQ
jgi:hypothetical protein